MLRAKIHNARVTNVLLHYEGSISIDRELLRKAGILPGEEVQVLNLNNGQRFTTYVMEGEKGEVTLNGPAARLAYPGDIVLILAYSYVSEEEARSWTYKVVYLDNNNEVVKIEEKGGFKIEKS